MSALGELPERALRSSLLSLSRRPRLGRLATRLPLTRVMVQRFVAGETLSEALDTIERLRTDGRHTTVDVLGESVATAEAAAGAAARYVELLNALAGRGLEGNVSLKLSQMGLDVSTAECRQNVGRVLARAAET
ncbi:MAG: proline dehydrogenase, partial [Candidatus Limnocylindrales bacterium]